MNTERLLNPRTIAVFGGAHAEELIRQCDRMGYDGEIWPVHPRKTESLGRLVYRSIDDLPGSPDAAHIGVNRHFTIDIVKALAARGAGGAICYATGFAEAGAQGAELRDLLLKASADMPLIGPNCYGLLNYVSGAMLWPDQQGGRRVDKGVGIITMSSNVGFNLTMQRRGLPIAYMISLGNRLKFDLHDAMVTLASQTEVTALGLFVEAIPNPKAFQEAVDFARALGKPVVVLKIGRSETAQKMVLSHTASLAGSDALIDALFARLGVARVYSLEALVEALKVLHVFGPLPGGRIGAMSTSGGDLTLLADALPPDLSTPPLSDKVAEQLRAILHERIVAANPFDFQMFDWNDDARLGEYFSIFMSEGFDISLCLLDYPRDDRCDQSTWGGAERAFVRAAKRTNSKAAMLATFSDTVSEAVAARLMDEGIAMLAGVDAALAGIQAAVDIGAAWSHPPRAPLLVRPQRNPHRPVHVLDEVESKTMLARGGVTIPPAQVVNDAAAAAVAADKMGYPVAVKAMGIIHKTDIGGVQLNLQSAEEVIAAVEAMENLSPTFLIERMIDDVVAEIIVGVATDEQFGPFLLVGSGGVLVELLKDSWSLLFPTTREDVLEALAHLHCAPLFHGFRGARPADLNAAADVILAVARMVEADPAAILELDINPLMLLADGQGAVAVDAMVRLQMPTGRKTNEG